MQTTLSIEDALLKIATDNDLTRVSISASVRYGFNATGHYNGFARSGIECSSGTGETVAEALQNMLNEARINRTPDFSADLPALVAEGLAA